MTPGQLREKVIAERVAWVREMLAQARGLPLATQDEFLADLRTAAAAESYLRRGLEALLDLGRHILAKGFGTPATEYKQIARELRAAGVLDDPSAALLERMAGYRNRMVHFYNEITDQELFELCISGTGDIESVLGALLAWIRDNPDRVDQSL